MTGGGPGAAVSRLPPVAALCAATAPVSAPGHHPSLVQHIVQPAGGNTSRKMSVEVSKGTHFNQYKYFR